MSLPFNIGRYKDGKEYLGQFPTNLEVPDTKGSTVKGVQYERGNTYLNNPKDPPSNYYKPLADYLAKNPPANLSGGQAQAIEDWAIAQARSENVYANADRDGIYSNGFEGWFVGAGVSYGYHWIIAPRFSMEFTLGIGYAFLDYKKTRCTDCRTVIGEEVKHYFGPTRAGISLVWMLK
ncbi:MAG: DUF3575 domain-containing protein [Tannerella sp.]|nr:DUF3575 domain-containing protein [Tannerella sp.]